jgi:hypothetical protein
VAKLFGSLHTSAFVWSGSRLRGVVNKAIGEEFLKYFEFALALNFLGVAADHCFGRVGNRDCTSSSNLSNFVHMGTDA